MQRKDAFKIQCMQILQISSRAFIRVSTCKIRHRYSRGRASRSLPKKCKTLRKTVRTNIGYLGREKDLIAVDGTGFTCAHRAMDGPHNEALDIIIFIMQLGHPILGTGRMTLKEYASEKNHGGLIKYLAMFFLTPSQNGFFLTSNFFSNLSKIIY